MKKSMSWILTCLTLAACSVPVDAAPPPTPLATATRQPAWMPTPTSLPEIRPTQTLAPTGASPFCDDPRGRELITSLTTAIQSEDGSMLSSLVSPSHGADVRFYRDGNAINYDSEHAKFVFETTYQADWGLSYGSGEATVGSFEKIVLPSLKQIFTTNAQVICDELKTGGITYEPVWPYRDMDFYSIHFSGTDEYGGLDWETWAVGMQNVAGNPYIAALVHYVWEP